MKHKTDHTRDRKRVEHAKNQKRERNVGANNAKRASNALLGEQRTNIRMSKLARTMQTAAAKINWSEMVKMLFRADPHSGRKDEIRKLISPGFESSLPYQASYSIDQVQYLLSLLLIISI